MLRVGVFGATGYTGFELIKLLVRHPQVQLAWLTSESYVGQPLSAVYACPWDYPLIASTDADLASVDVVFLCLPHGASADAVQRCWEADVRAIDLSADFRLPDPTEYQQWYGQPHAAPQLLREAVYGLPELFRDQIREARLVANPGCYPTSVILGLYPLVKADLLEDDLIIVDAKSGVSGAGRKPTLKTHFVEAHDNLSPYNIGHTHRHIPEMEGILSRLRKGGQAVRVIFSPHLLPVNQGILATMYVRAAAGWSAEQLYELYRDTYADEPFVYVLPPGQLATLRHATYTNRCAISLTPVDGERWIVCSAIDNLLKGASGQAVQNMNVMFGLEETAGLL